MAAPIVTSFGLQAGTTRTMYANWSWSKANTASYDFSWRYRTSDQIVNGLHIWFWGQQSNTTNMQSVYTAPENALEVCFCVKAIAQTHKVNNVDTVYWVEDWSKVSYYSFSANPPSMPPVPSPRISNYQMIIEMTGLPTDATHIELEIVQNNLYVYKKALVKIDVDYVIYTITVEMGSDFKARARSYKNGLYSNWTDYSNNLSTIPLAPQRITTCRANTSTSVYIEWTSALTATSYELEYTTKKSYFDNSSETTTISSIQNPRYEVTGLDSGSEYFFRVRSVNDNGSSGWSPIASVILGKNPSAPTTWSSTTSAIVGEPLTLYWVHNSEDGSRETLAELERYVDGVRSSTIIPNPGGPDDPITTRSYSVDTSVYSEGTVIQWRVRTAGITNTYGEWSVQRTVNIYARPSLNFRITDVNGASLDTITEFPFYAKALAGPNTQRPIGFHLSIKSNEQYETSDRIGNQQVISAGQEIYSQYFDIDTNLDISISAYDVDLEANISYTATCTVSMNSGLTAEESVLFTVSWTDDKFEPSAEIGIDTAAYTANIRPYCEDDLGSLISGIELSVYRREYDGSFVEIASRLPNTHNTYVTDPHPPLDFARYRIIATTLDTGSVSYYDLPGYPVQCKSIIIQWDESWSTFEVDPDDTANLIANPPYSGSLLKLDYNIDTSTSNDLDVEMVEYIGRSHPTSYYGTQVGEIATWSVDIPKTDQETVYSIRRLSKWTGNAYVREPMGSGYWANISISFSEKHLETHIPITMSLVRVEGGM